MSFFDIWSGDECFQVLTYSLLTNCPDITITVDWALKIKYKVNPSFFPACEWYSALNWVHLH